MSPKKQVKSATLEIEDLKVCKSDHKIASEAVQKAATAMQQVCAIKKKKKDR